MPVVPTASVPSVAPSGESGLPYQTSAGATPDAFGAAIGQAETAFGTKLEKTGDTLQSHAMKLQEDLNVSHAEDLFLNGSIELGNLQEKYKSLEGSARVNALPKFMEDATAIREKYKGSAPNSDVNKKFDQLFTRQLGYAVREAGGLAGQATRQYMRDTSKAVQANSLNEIAKNSEDDQQFMGQTQTGLESMRAQSDYEGASPEVKKAMDENFVSTAWGTRLQTMMINNPQRARDLFQKNKDSMDGTTRLKLEPQINQAIINKDVPMSSDKIIQDLGTGAMEERVKFWEGYRDKPYSDGRQTSVGYGTRAQPGDENIPPERRQAVFTQRLRNELASAYQIVDNFAPGLPKGARDALADLTYNAGSAWTSAGLGQAVRAGDMATAQQRLLAYDKADGVSLPGLAARRNEELKWWKSDTSSPDTDPLSVQGKALDKARERAAAVFPDNPELQASYLDRLQSRITSDLGVMQNAAKNNQLAVQNQIYREIFNDPAHPISSVDKLSPSGQALYNAAPVGLQRNIDSALRKAASMDVPPTNEGAKRFSELQGLATRDPEAFSRLNLDDEKTLTRGQKGPLIQMQVKQEELVKRGIKVDGAMKSMHPFLNDAGISDSASDNNKTKEYLRFRGTFEAALNTAEAEKKRELYPKEITDIGQGLLKQIVTDPGWAFVPFTGETKKAYQLEVRKGNEASDYAKIPAGSIFKHPDGSYRMKPNG